MRAWDVAAVLLGLCVLISSAPAAGLLEQMKATVTLKAEDLGEPVKTTRRGKLLYAPNPDGKSWDLLQIYFPQYGGPNTIIIADLGSGEVRQVHTPRQPIAYNLHLCPTVLAPNGKLYISILQRGGQGLCVYDPATNKLTFDAVKLSTLLPGSTTHPMQLGTDGKLYLAGEHPSQAATIVQIDPKTHNLVTYGPVGPSHKPNQCWAYSVAADDTHVYVASGKVPWYLVAFDRKTRTSTVLAETGKVDGNVSVRQHRGGCSAVVSDSKDGKTTRREFWLVDGKAIAKKDRTQQPPWKQSASAAEPALPPRPEVWNDSDEEEGHVTLWYRTAAAKAAATGAPAGATPEQLGWKAIRQRVPIYPHSIQRLTELPDGRIFGTAGAYMGNFMHDPATGKSLHLGRIHLSHYATAIQNGKVYMSGYPSSPVYVYDLAKPWTALTQPTPMTVIRENHPESNPRRMCRLRDAKAHKMYAAAVGADGKIYFGGRWMRNGNSGALGWWDPKTQTPGGMWKPLSNYQVNFMTAVDGGKTLVISAHRVADTLLDKPKPAQGALLFFDVTTGKIVGKCEPVAGAKGAGPVVAIGGRVVGWAPNGDDAKTSVLYAVDVATREIVLKKILPLPLPVSIGSNQTERWDFRLGPDGAIWTFLDRQTLVRINPNDLAVTVVGKIPAGRLAFSGRNVYLGGSTHLRRVKDLLPAR